MSGPYQGLDLSNCGVGRLRVAINCGVLTLIRLRIARYLVHIRTPLKWSVAYAEVTKRAT